MFRSTGLILSLTVLLVLCSSVTLADNAGLSDHDEQGILFVPEEPVSGHRQERQAHQIARAVRRGDMEEAFRLALAHARDYNKGTRVNLLASDQYVLGVGAVGQETTYYCGPASAVQLLLFWNLTQHPTEGRPTTQSNLAADLGTTTSGTSFPGYWASTLCSWSNQSYYTIWAPSENQLWNSTVTDVLLYRPLIYDAVMNSTNGYLPGYSSGTIYHYVTGDGYQEGGYGCEPLIHYVDPNRYRSAAFGPHWTTLNQMWKCVRDRGIVW